MTRNETAVSVTVDIAGYVGRGENGRGESECDEEANERSHCCWRVCGNESAYIHTRERKKTAQKDEIDLWQVLYKYKEITRFGNLVTCPGCVHVDESDAGKGFHGLRICIHPSE